MNKKRTKAWIAVKILYTLMIVAVLVGLVIVSFIMKGKWKLISMGFADIGVYGALIFSFLLFQQLFSLMNNNLWIPKLVKKANLSPRTNIQVVGYREDLKLFTSCLTSLSLTEYNNLGQILVGIDGNEENDLKMVEVFKEVFPNGVVVNLTKLFQQMTDQQKQSTKLITSQNKYVCITQPHKGKRDIMYTCFHCHSDTAQLIALTDSDTMWQTDTLKSLVDVMVGHDQYRKEHNQKLKWWQFQVKQCGSVTGDVGIWNKQNYISYLSALRYWFAFNVQRAADSYFGVVNCVSGPLGLYRRHHLQQISQGWISQEFMGDKCTFGDDRNLSNRILELGLSIFYTPFSKCETDTPAQLLRWIPQQTRWCKSFYREFLYNVKSFYKHSIWMSVELVFQFVYPFFIIITLVWFITESINMLLVIYSFIIIMGTIRGSFGIFRTCKLQFFHYTIYVFLYILFLIPCKLWALLTLWNNQWGTSSRFVRYQNVLKAIHSLVWAVALTAYMIIFFVKFLAFDKSSVDLGTIIMSSVCTGFCVLLLVHWNIWGTCFLVPEVEANLQERYRTDKQINLNKRTQLTKISSQQNLNMDSQKNIMNETM